ncbi:reverse transcriptase domain-containing protein, partial [Tanacetum coccineum]
MTARISIPAPVPTPAWSDSEVARLLAISTLPASPLSPWSSPLPQIPFPPLPLIPSPSLPSPPSPVLSPTAPPHSPIRSLGYRAAMIRLRAEATSTSHPPLLSSPLPISAPTSSPPLLLPSASHREDRPEVTLPPRKRLGIALGPRYEVGESSSTAVARPTRGLRADYGFIANMDREIRRDPERDIGYKITDSWDEIIETLQGHPDKRAHARTRHLMETEARMSRKAWGHSMDASGLAHAEVISLRTIVFGQQSEIRDLQSTDRRRQTQISELLTVDHKNQRQLTKAMIDQGVTAALAARDAVRSTNGDDSHNSGTGLRRTERATREFKFATCTLHSVALTWWNTHVKTVGHDAAYGMPWKTLMKMMTAKYCPRNKIKKLEMEIWDLKVKKSDKIERYIGGLPDMIHGSVVASKPKTMQEAVEIATELMDQKIRTFSERESTSKRKFESTSRNTQNQQQNKRQNTGRAYTAAP